ncbi:MAG: hypothetical protein WC791_04535 [Candidatus Paceibacterota bacterium]|jgi:hypothetical protein
MYNISDVPPELQDAAKLLEAQIVEAQKKCQHIFEKVMGKDPHYWPSLYEKTQLDDDWNVIKEFHCTRCNFRKPFRELPFIVCHQCGGLMKLDHTEQFGGERAHIHKCTSCGHEYDTT